MFLMSPDGAVGLDGFNDIFLIIHVGGLSSMILLILCNTSSKEVIWLNYFLIIL